MCGIMQRTQSQNSACPAQIRIGTRASQLAVAQATEVRNRLLGAFPELTQSQIDIIKIRTTGDKIQDKNLAEIGGKGLFTKELEEALLEGSIDIAVHSMKDMPDTLPPGMVINCVLEREDPRDAFVSYKYTSLAELPQGSVIGTSSVRRQSQLLAQRPDLRIVPFRGNVPTRLEKLERGDVDATILAAAGLNRLFMSEQITSIMEVDFMVPAVAQGAIGIECLEQNMHLPKVLERINHAPSLLCVRAERAFLKGLGGTCTTPIGALAVLNDTEVHFTGCIAAPDGKVIYRTERTGRADDAVVMAEDAAQELKQKGRHILTWKC